MENVNKREFLAASIGAGITLSGVCMALAQDETARPDTIDRGASTTNRRVPTRRVRTTKLFKTPDGFPNAIAVNPEGLWIAEQKETGEGATKHHLREPKDLTEHAWLVDWNGTVLKTVATQSRTTSGLAVGGGYVWMFANAPPEGVFQVDMNSKQVSHRQIPLGPANDGGGCHGALWHDGKLWIASLRLRGILRVDPTSWEPEFMIPFHQDLEKPRFHAIAWDNGGIWQIIGNDCRHYSDYRPALVKYDAATGRVLEAADFEPNSCDPHGLAMHDGALISCDAGSIPIGL